MATPALSPHSKLLLLLLLSAVACLPAATAAKRPPPPKAANSGDDELDKIISESDVMKLMQRQADRHDKKLDALHHRLESELATVNTHFNDLLEKMQKAEFNLEGDLKKLENAVLSRVEDVKVQTESAQSSWRWPFFFLFVVLGGIAAFFTRLYRKATKHSHLG